MAFRRLKAKKYKGISEYYNPKDRDKVTLAYYGDYRDATGKAKKKKLNAKNLNEALEELNGLRQQADNQKEQINDGVLNVEHLVRNKRLTLNKMAELFFEDRKTKNNSKDEGVYENRIKPLLGKKSAAKITTEDVTTLQIELTENKNNFFTRTYAPKTVNETLNILRAMFNEGLKRKNGWCSINPVTVEPIKKLQEIRDSGRILSDSELKLLFDTVENGNYKLSLAAKPIIFLFLKCLYFTGARPEAILSLRVQDISMHEKKIHLKAMKLSDAYSIAVKEELIELLQDRINEYHLKYGDYIFFPTRTFNQSQDPSDKQKHTAYGVINKLTRPYFAKLFNQNIPQEDVMNRISFYSLRRTSGTKIYKAKGIYHAMTFLNHTSVKTTQKYLNVQSDMGDIADVL